MKQRGTLCNSNFSLIARLAKHQSIRALEGLEARLSHLLRGWHKGGAAARHQHQELHQQERSKSLLLVKKVYFYISPTATTTEAIMDSKGSDTH